MTPVRQEVGPAVAVFLPRRVELRHRLRRAPRLRYTKDRAGRAGRKQNHAITAPRPAAPGRRITQRLRRSPGHGDPLQFSVLEKPDASAVPGPERIHRILTYHHR